MTRARPRIPHPQLIALVAFIVSGCAAKTNPPPLTVTGGALSFPPIGHAIPVSLVLRGDPSGATFKVKREDIAGITTKGAAITALSLGEAAECAGGSQPLLAALSNEDEVAHVVSKAGRFLGESAGIGFQACGAALRSPGNEPYAAALALVFCAGSIAIGTSVGLVGAMGIGSYYAVASDSRRFDMIEQTLLPDDQPGNPLQGYIFLPVDDYQSLRVITEDTRTDTTQTVEIPWLYNPTVPKTQGTTNP